MEQGFVDVLQTESKLWTPLHIRPTNNSSVLLSQQKTVCTPQETCNIYEKVLERIHQDNDTLRRMIENIEIEQQCLKELLHDDPHWMGSVNGTQRKLMHCSMNLENILEQAQKESGDILDISARAPARRESNSNSSQRTISAIRRELIRIHTITPDSDKTHYVFSVKKVNSTFWATSARLLHVDLTKKQIYITKDTKGGRVRISDDFNEQKTSASAPTSNSHDTLSQISDHSNRSNETSQTNSSYRSNKMKTSSLSECDSLKVTGSSSIKLVDWFRDPHHDKLQAVLCFKLLNVHTEEHDKLLFKSYLFEKETDLIQCEERVYTHLFSISPPNPANRRVINWAKLANVHIEVRLDDSALRAARLLFLLWQKDHSKDEILQLSDCDQKRRRSWMTENGKFIAVSTIKICVILGCTIRKNKNQRRGPSNTHSQGEKENKLPSAELRWLASAASRHVYGIWSDREKFNNFQDKNVQCKCVPYARLSMTEKNRYTQETSMVIEYLQKDGFIISIPKEVQRYMF